MSTTEFQSVLLQKNLSCISFRHTTRYIRSWFRNCTVLFLLSSLHYSNYLRISRYSQFGPSRMTQRVLRSSRKIEAQIRKQKRVAFQLPQRHVKDHKPCTNGLKQNRDQISIRVMIKYLPMAAPFTTKGSCITTRNRLIKIIDVSLPELLTDQCSSVISWPISRMMQTSIVLRQKYEISILKLDDEYQNDSNQERRKFTTLLRHCSIQRENRRSDAHHIFQKKAQKQRQRCRRHDEVRKELNQEPHFCSRSPHISGLIPSYGTNSNCERACKNVTAW